MTDPIAGDIIRHIPSGRIGVVTDVFERIDVVHGITSAVHVKYDDDSRYIEQHNANVDLADNESWPEFERATREAA